MVGLLDRVERQAFDGVDGGVRLVAAVMAAAVAAVVVAAVTRSLQRVSYES